MIICSGDGTLAVVRQVDHQIQCGVLARAWGNDVFARPPHYDDLIVAAQIHDEGWRGWEEHPRIDPKGRPMDFPDLAREEHIPLYERGIRMAADVGPRVGLIVSMHGQGLYEKRLGLDGIAPARDTRPDPEQVFLAAQDDLQRNLCAQINDPDATQWAWAGFRLLQAWDTLSLYLTWRGLPRGATWTLPRVPRHVGDDGVEVRLKPGDDGACTVDPWPFHDNLVEAPVAMRRVPDRTYVNDADLAEELDRQPWAIWSLALHAAAQKPHLA
jgi:Protein of unknown function (DUF3891)